MITDNGQRTHRPQLLGAPNRDWWRRALQAFKQHAEGGAMAARWTARAEVVVDASQEDAFRMFTDEIGIWWRTNTPYWNDRARGLSVRIEPGVGGRFVEVYDLDTGAGFEVGHVTAWEPGERIVLTWKQLGWPNGVSTDLEITFEAVDHGTLVRVEHSGFERVGAAADEFRAGYQSGWQEILAWFDAHVTTRNS